MSQFHLKALFYNFHFQFHRSLVISSLNSVKHVSENKFMSCTIVLYLFSSQLLDLFLTIFKEKKMVAFCQLCENNVLELQYLTAKG